MAPKVALAGVQVARIGLSTAALKVAGMWGEPLERTASISVIRRAVELGAELIEVPAPFGPWADLVREAAPEGALVCLRLTGPAPGEMQRAVATPGTVAARIEAARRRLGPSTDPRLVLVEPRLLDAAREAHPGAVGVVVDSRTSMSALGEVAAVRGPYPVLRPVLEWCEARRIPYMCNNARVLSAGDHTVALLEPSSRSEVERLFAGVRGAEAPTRPGARPG